MRRLLLISYHFPPSEAAGALRWQRYTTIAAEYGWSVDAITLAPGSTERQDWGRVAELPPSTRIHGVLQPEPIAGRLEHAVWRAWRAIRGPRPKTGGPGGKPATVHRKEITWLAGGPRSLRRISNVLLDYARDAAWSRAAVETGIRVAREHPPDVILSCGPPHRVHEAGRLLARALRLPLVMDMRDPWSLQTRLQEEVATPLWFSMASWEEARCVKTANLIVMNTPLAAEFMQAEVPGKRVIWVLNGWDDEPLPRSPWPHQFRVVYAGTIYIDRNPRPLFHAVADAVRELEVSPAEFEVRLIGGVESFGGESVTSLAEREGVAGFVRVLPPLPRSAVLKEYAEAGVLLSLPQDSHYAIPSKVYEYMRQPCWVMAQTSPESATGTVLRNTSAFLVEPDDVTRTSEILVRCYREFRAGRRPEPIARDGLFSRKAEGAKLFAALESVIGNGADRA